MTRRRAWGAVLALVAIVVLAGAVGASVQKPGIDDFEDNDTTVDSPNWNTWTGDLSEFKTTDNALAGNHSGLWDPTSENQSVNVLHGGTGTPDNATWLASAQGETSAGITVDHEFRIYNDGDSTPMITVLYRENATNNYGNISVRHGNGITKIGEWEEDASGVQRFEVDFDFNNDNATVYLNETAHGPFDWETSNAHLNWDEFMMNSTSTSGVALGAAEIRVDEIGGDNFTVSAPTVNNSEASPRNNEIKESGAVALSIPVNDSDFPRTDVSESVDVEFYLDGSKVDTQTITSNQTLSYSASVADPGSHTWHAELEDDFGVETTSETFDFRTTANLSIYNETSPETLIKENVTVRFFGEDQVFTKNTSDGTLNLSALPQDETLIARASADGFHARTKIIPSLFEEERMYLLNTTISTYEVRFTLNDQSGKFPQDESKIFIKKPLKRNGTTEFETIFSDEFGATGATVDLEQEKRYRLVIKNAQGDSRNVGPYTAEATETVSLTPGVADVNLDPDPDTYVWGAEFQNETGQYGTVVAEYNDPFDQTDALDVTIHERGNESNVFVDTTINGPLGNATVTYALQNADERNITYAVDFSADRNGETHNKTEYVGIQPDERLPGLDDWMQEALAFVTLILLGASFTARDHHLGAVVLPIFAGFFWYMQWLEGTTSGAAIVLALGIAGGLQIARGARQ